MNLESKYINEIKNIISREINEDYKLYLFGSRALNNNRKYSDADILLETKNQIDFDSYLNIRSNLSESDIPYIVDISDKSRMDKEFFGMIENQLIEI